MTLEEKQLLLKDLCARLHYGVKIKTSKGDGVLCSIDYIPNGAYLGISINGAVKDYYEYQDTKVYLRPIKSMTQEECDKLFKILNIDEGNGEWLKINDIGVLRLFTENGKDFYEIAEAMDYLYSIHVDFRDMIEKGLALEAPDGMYKTE